MLTVQTTVDADTFHPRDDTDRAQTAEAAAAAARGAPLGLPEPGNPVITPD